MKIENEEMIVNFGALGYDAKKIGIILDVSEEDVLKEMINENSKFSRLLQKGKNMSDYVIDLKIFDMAKSGDMKAIEMFKKRKNKTVKKRYEIPENSQ